MVKRKSKIRVTVMLIIITLVLIPLLSSNVSALVTWSAGTGWTNNFPPPVGPRAGGVMSGAGVIVDGGGGAQASVQFTFGYTFQDTTLAGLGSNHLLVMTVSWPGGGFLWTVTGPIWLAPGGILVGTHTTPIITNPRGTTYTITVTITCTDLNVPPLPPFVWGPMATTCTVN